MRRGTFTGGAVALAAAVGAGAMADAEVDVVGPGTTRIEVEHLPDRIATRTRVTPESLAAFPELERAAFTEPAVVARLVAAARASRPQFVAGDVPFDCRWLLRFSGGAGRTALAFDAFGRRGRLDGRPVDLGARKLIAALRDAHPGFDRG